SAMKLAMTVTVKMMDSQRWICRIQLFQFNGPSPVGRVRSLVLEPELLGVLGVQSPPPAELHRRGPGKAAHGSLREAMVHHIETDVPPRGTQRDEAAIDTGPEGETGAGTDRLELPSDVVTTPVVHQQAGSVRAADRRFRDLRRLGADGRELSRASRCA